MTDINRPAGRPVLQPARVRTTGDDFERRYGKFGEREQRQIPIQVEDVRAAENGRSQDFTVRGHASVFDMWSLDLGGFKEKIARGAFDRALERNPDTWFLWDHDTRYVLARTTNKTLELRLDARGLHYWARVAPTSYAADLRVLMERGDIDQASFAFTVAKDEWRIVEDDDTGEERVERTILEIGDLFDVTVTAMGAYPQTDSQLVGERARDYAIENGRLPDTAEPEAEASPLDTEGEASPGEADAEHRAAPEPDETPELVAEETNATESLAALRADTREAVRAMRERHLLAMKELTRS